MEIITHTSDLDYEATTNSYVLILHATDTAQAFTGAIITATATVIITVEPANEHTPAFSSTSMTNTINENSPIGAMIAYHVASDEDASPHNIAKYTINQVTQNGDVATDTYFIINSGTGEIKLAKELDYDTLPTGDKTYQIEVYAIDGGTPAMTGSATITVTVEDDNDVAPICSQLLYVLTVPENSDNSYEVIPDLGCTDIDSSSLTYTVQPSTMDSFTVDIYDSIVNLKPAGTLDYESGTINYAFTIEVTDSVHTATISVSITITDVNEAPPVFDPRSYTNSIAENAIIGASVITVTATDADTADDASPHGIAKYTINQVTQNGAAATDKYFTINSVTGEIKLAKVLDYETLPAGDKTYQIEVFAIDGGTPAMTGTATITVTVEDDNEVAPIFSQLLYVLTVPENSNAACTWPSTFANSVWEGTRGQLTFGSSTLGGLVIDVSSLDPSAGSLSSWECVNTDYFPAEGILLLKSTTKFNHINAHFLAYFCFTMTRVSGVQAFYFYQTHAMEPSLNNERIKIHQDETFTTKAKICGAIPPVHEFHYMVRQGQELVSKQFCPPSLLARMEYNVTSSSGAVSCTGPADIWDVCTHRTDMTFNYSTCATKMMYSNEGRAYCMFNLTATHHYTMVYTNGTSGSKFLCVVSNAAGTAASFVEGRCGQFNQSPTTFATLDGSNVGFTVTMSAAETCPFLEPTTPAVNATTPTSGASSPSNTNIVPIIVGVVVGVLVAMAIVGILVYFFKCRKSAKVEHWGEKSGPPGVTVNGYDVEQADGQGLSTETNGSAGNPHVVPTTIGEAENPALKEVQRQTLSPLPNSKAFNGSFQPVIPPINYTV